MFSPADTDSKVCKICKESRRLKLFGSLPEKRGAVCRYCIIEKRLERGLCRHGCGQPAVPNRNHCEKCLKGQRINASKRNQRDREAAIDHYGLTCQCCADERFLFLTIDHIDGGGVAHMRKLREGGYGGHNLYAWLRKNNYPTGFRTLCYNCNCVRGRVGYCPHQSTAPSIITPALAEFVLPPRPCQMCGRDNTTTTGRCAKCNMAIRKSTNKRRQLDREAILNHYGSACAYCNESIKEFLTIDHINNDGANHRMISGSGYNLYRWLRKNNYPAGFQTLCYGCNIVKAQIGEEFLLKYLTENPRPIGINDESIIAT